ncbi:hypothetical protein RHA1_ro08952 (plasmid) [Rhodococcus jostii RHA1]|uniref:Uncharacterized protein n=1 Tax=Rhodococcus jostii (strain RHA1) TaxID=101510 RepID=Q0RXJ0_RHOJR|nr:hypothetical protein RHA1_ro08952 [Rhodococcus jostii RHA1]
MRGRHDRLRSRVASAAASAPTIPGQILRPGDPIERPLGAGHQPLIERTPIYLHHRPIRILFGKQQVDDRPADRQAGGSGDAADGPGGIINP